MKDNRSKNTGAAKQQKKEAKKDWGQYFFIGAALLITIFTFRETIDNGFVSFDDTGYITNNNLIKDISFHSVKHMFEPTTYLMGNYHPIVVLCDAVIYSMFKLEAKPYHVFNLLLHLANVILVFVFIRELLGINQIRQISQINQNPKINQIPKIGQIDFAAAVATCLFAVHPLHVENVAWASDLKDLLFTLFYISAMLFYIKYIRNKTEVTSGKTKEGRGIMNDILIYSGTLLFFLLSLWSKSAAVTFPLVLFLLDYYYGRKLSLRSVMEKLPLLCLSLVFGVINILSQKAAGAIVTSYTFNYADRFFMLCYSLMYYLYSFIFPHHLANLHFFPVKINEVLPYYYYISPVFLSGVLLLVIFWIRKTSIHGKDIIFGMLFFLITIFLVLQFTPFGFAVVSERYVYLPYTGLLFIAARYLTQMKRLKQRNQVYIYSILAVVILIFSVSSFERNKAWKTSTGLLVDLTEKYPDQAMAFDDLGVARMLSSDLQGAITEFDQALKINPTYYYSYNNRGEAKRYRSIEEAKKNNTALADAFAEEAWQDYNKAILLYPTYSDAYNNRAIIKFNKKDYIGSLVDCTMSIINKPDNPNAYNNRASSRMSLNDFSGAMRDYDSALKLNPYYADGYKNRGVSRFNQKDVTGACEDWKRASELGNTQAGELVQGYCR